jgi:hypothetical protein
MDRCCGVRGGSCRGIADADHAVTALGVYLSFECVEIVGLLIVFDFAHARLDHFHDRLDIALDVEIDEINELILHLLRQRFQHQALHRVVAGDDHVLHVVALDDPAQLVGDLLGMRFDHVLGAALEQHLAPATSLEAPDLFVGLGLAGLLSFVERNHEDPRFLAVGQHHRVGLVIIEDTRQVENVRIAIFHQVRLDRNLKRQGFPDAFGVAGKDRQAIGIFGRIPIEILHDPLTVGLEALEVAVTALDLAGDQIKVLLQCLQRLPLAGAIGPEVHVQAQKRMLGTGQCRQFLELCLKISRHECSFRIVALKNVFQQTSLLEICRLILLAATLVFVARRNPTVLMRLMFRLGFLLPHLSFVFLRQFARADPILLGVDIMGKL